MSYKEVQEKQNIIVPEGQGVPEETKKLIEGGEFVQIPKEKVEGFVTIAFVKANPNPNAPPVIRYEFQNIAQLSLPTLLRKVANDIERELTSPFAR